MLKARRSFPCPSHLEENQGGSGRPSVYDEDQHAHKYGGASFCICNRATVTLPLLLKININMGMKCNALGIVHI